MVAFEQVRWIGGGSGAGKSTVARLLGDRHRLRVVQTDLALHRHAEEVHGRPLVDAFVAMTPDERWVDRAPDEMLGTFPWFQGEGHDLLLDELRAMPDGGVVLVEGFRLLPELLAPLLGGAGRAVWLLPTPARRADAFRGREAQGRAFWQRTGDPARALANLLERDRLFTERLRLDTERLGLQAVHVDGQEGVDAVAGRVERLLGLA